MCGRYGPEPPFASSTLRMAPRSVANATQREATERQVAMQLGIALPEAWSRRR